MGAISRSSRAQLPRLLPLLLQVHCEEGPGDILIFLTGQEEIESCERLITERGAALPPQIPDGGGDGGDGGDAGGGQPTGLLVLPIYASLPPEQQLKVFQPAPPGIRKVGWVPAIG
jgi:ATP-dependent RNA helicase DHX8/PRP22